MVWIAFTLGFLLGMLVTLALVAYALVGGTGGR